MYEQAPLACSASLAAQTMPHHACVAIVCGFVSELVVFAILYLAWLLIGKALSPRKPQQPGSGEDLAENEFLEIRRTPAGEAAIQEGRRLLIEAVLRNPDVQEWISRGDSQSPERRVQAPPESSSRDFDSLDCTPPKVHALSAKRKTTREKGRPPARRAVSFHGESVLSRKALSPIDELRIMSWQSSPDLELPSVAVNLGA